MRIETIEITHHRLPLKPAFQASWDPRPRSHFDATIVRIGTDEGVTGIGSGYGMLGFENYVDLFIGQDPRMVERHWRVLEGISFHTARCWPFDLALWDLYGKAVGEPVWRLLGGRTSHLQCYASTGALRDPWAAADTAEQLMEMGFPAIKLRFNRPDWHDDITVLEAVRERVGDAIDIMVDCNQGWRMPWDIAGPWQLKKALSVIRELAHLDVYWVEDPLDRSDHEGLRMLRQETPIRIGGGEMNQEMDTLRNLITSGSVDIVQSDVTLIGGITGLRRIASMAEAHGMMFSPHSWSNGIGMLANAHLTAGICDTPYFEFPFDPPEWTTERRDFILSEPVQPDDEGWLSLPETPGLGFELDERVLKKTRIG